MKFSVRVLQKRKVRALCWTESFRLSPFVPASAHLSDGETDQLRGLKGDDVKVIDEKDLFVEGTKSKGSEEVGLP